MPRNLRDDYRMYYNSTYITRLHPTTGKLEVMYVEDVSYSQNGFVPEHITMHGQTYGLDAKGKLITLETRAWTGAMINPLIPECGYYSFGAAPQYIEFTVQNRSNRRGFEAGRATADGMPTRLSTTNILTMFLKPYFKGKLFQDCCIHKSRILWRGEDVGSFHNGVMELSENFEYLRDHIGKQIELFRNQEGN